MMICKERNFSTLKQIISLSILLTIIGYSCKNSSSSATELSQEVSIDQVAALVKDEGYKVIDLRTPEEVKESGTIPNSLILDYRSANFENLVDKLDKDQGYILYCKSGGRSGRALKLFNEKGFKKIREMNAGYDKWAAKYNE